MLKPCSIFLLLLCAPAWAFADDDSGYDIDALMDIPLEELVYVASKSYQKIEDAPGVVNVIKRSQFERFGAKNLADVLNYATSFHVSSKLFFRNSTSSVRSVNRRMLDGHTLLLVNGRPMRDSIAGSINTPIYSGFPIDIIEHVEVIRGPGSVLYGSNAYSSVVNIVTYKPKLDDVAGQVKLSRGSYTTRGVEASVYGAHESNNYLLSGRYFESDGWHYEGNNTSGNPVSTDMYELDKSIFGYYKNGSFTFNGFKSKRKDLHINAFSSSPPFVTHETGRDFADFGYEVQLNEDDILDFNLTYNGLYSGDIYGFEGDGNSYLLETNYKTKQLNGDLNLLIGATAEYREARNKTVKAAYSRDFSWYAQGDYRINEQTKLIAGVQANRPNIQSWDYSPRLAVNHKFNDESGVKLSYGKAFRTPSLLELYSTSIGVETLEPEIVRTYDLQFYHRGVNSYAALTFYNTRQENAISGQGAGAPYENGTTTVHRGVEIEGHHYLSDENYIQGSLTWQRSKDENSVEGWGWAPSFMAKLGYSYTPVHGLYDVGLFAHYYSDQTRINDLNSNYDAINPNPDAYTWLTLKSKLNLDKMWNLPRDTVSVDVFAENLLDEDVYTTTTTIARYNSNMSRSGRTVMANLRVQF